MITFTPQKKQFSIIHYTELKLTHYTTHTIVPSYHPLLMGVVVSPNPGCFRPARRPRI